MNAFNIQKNEYSLTLVACLGPSADDNNNKTPWSQNDIWEIIQTGCLYNVIALVGEVIILNMDLIWQYKKQHPMMKSKGI